jgi:hypothetical protein
MTRSNLVCQRAQKGGFVQGVTHRTAGALKSSFESFEELGRDAFLDKGAGKQLDQISASLKISDSDLPPSSNVTRLRLLLAAAC